MGVTGRLTERGRDDVSSDGVVSGFALYRRCALTLLGGASAHKSCDSHWSL